MNQSTSHPVKALDITVAYPMEKGVAVIHKTGCSHSLRRGPYDDDPMHLGTGFEAAADEYFFVSPCARKA